MDSINITFIRHGEPKQLGLLLGHTDMGLSKLGEQQLEDKFTNLQFDRLITSPLKRCSQFANKVAKQCNVGLEIEHDIKEMNFGDWDGLSYEALWQQSPSVGDFWQNPTKVTPPNGESLVSFQARVNNWWQKLIQQNSGDVVVITHAGVIKQVLASLFNDQAYLTVPTKIKVNYAAIVKVQVTLDNKGNAWPMLNFN